MEAGSEGVVNKAGKSSVKDLQVYSWQIWIPSWHKLKETRQDWREMLDSVRNQKQQQ